MSETALQTSATEKDEASLRGVLRIVLPDGMTLSDELLLELGSQNEIWGFESDAAGALLILPPAGTLHGHRGVEIGARLHNWAEVEAGGGVFAAGALFRLPDGNRRAPDAAWLSLDRLSRVDEDDEGIWPVTPDLVVEIRSRNDQLPQLQEKMALWLRNGARLGWLVDPFGEQLWVYRPGAEAQMLARPESIADEDVLPGLAVDLRRIWRRSWRRPAVARCYGDPMVTARLEHQTVNKADDVSAQLAALGIAPLRLRLPEDWVLTNETLLELCSLNDAVPFEVDETGALILNMPSGPTSEWIGVRIVLALGNWSDDEAGDLVFASGGMFELPDGNRRAPDAAWISGARLTGIDIFDGDVWRITPDFVVEVRSLSDKIDDLQSKMELWLRNGARLGWLVDPFGEQLWVYRPGAEPLGLERPESIADDEVLPGLVVDLRRIWRRS